MAGDQVPSMPLVEVVGSVNAVPLQMGPTCVNVGVSEAVTVIVALPENVPEQTPLLTAVSV